MIIIFSLFITIMYIVLCCKHLKLCYNIAKSLEIKGEHKDLSKKREATWRSSGTLTQRQRKTREQCNFLFWHTFLWFKMCNLSVSSLRLPSNLTLLEVSHKKWRKVNICFSGLKLLSHHVSTCWTLQRQTELKLFLTSMFSSAVHLFIKVY